MSAHVLVHRRAHMMAFAMALPLVLKLDPMMEEEKELLKKQSYDFMFEIGIFGTGFE